MVEAGGKAASAKFHEQVILDKSSSNTDGKLAESRPATQPPMQPSAEDSNPPRSDPTTASASPTCPQCSSTSVYRDGQRYLTDGSVVQRWFCRNCAYRFSQTDCSGSNHSQRVSRVDTQPLNRGFAYSSNRQVCDLAEESKNLAEVTRQEIAQREGTTQTTANVEAEVMRYLIWLRNQGFSHHTIRSRANLLKWIMTKKADLNDPETVKAAIANASNWCETTKLLATTAYDSFLKWQGKTWIPPRYKQIQKLPFIPTEEELDALIIAGSKRLATLLQILKETGVRLGEALMLEWTDIDFERNVIRINHPEKGSNPRILIMSKKLANMINTLPKKNQMVLDRNPKTCETALWNLRRKEAFKLQNPRLQSITFHTFRHWKATTEYHKTHDIFHVQRLLGHRNIQNTAIYITLENGMFQTENNDFHVTVAKTLEDACKLLEVGFEYVCDMHDAKLFRKRK